VDRPDGLVPTVMEDRPSALYHAININIYMLCGMFCSVGRFVVWDVL